MNNFDGMKFCIHTKSIELSNNRIADLSPLEDLTNLEDLNLSGNEISYIDGLGFLSGLRILNLSNNLIDDLEPLFRLKNLEYVDTSGNKVIGGQINILIKSGVAIDF
jgi:internalin A